MIQQKKFVATFRRDADQLDGVSAVTGDRRLLEEEAAQVGGRRQVGREEVVVAERVHRLQKPDREPDSGLVRVAVGERFARKKELRRSVLDLGVDVFAVDFSEIQKLRILIRILCIASSTSYFRFRT